ncbi:MAG: carbon-nitrogen hydrolase family protein [Verrucomicrobiae bacterium]|nr:carbon-nitrogen hydrolase family protein [Verrucomicrobiae bacterium]
MKRKPTSTWRVATMTVDIQTLATAPTRSVREDFIFAQLQTAVASAPDLVVLPEACWCYGMDWNQWGAEAEPRESKRVRAVAALARKHRAYVAMPILERRGNRTFNTLLLLNRNGRIVWHYDKMFLTGGEIKLGITRGRHVRAYDADFGRVGAAICFDLNFLELAHAWEKQEVDVILFSSMYRGGPTVATWSTTAHAYVITATADEGSQIVDPLGRNLGRTSFYNPVLVRDLPRDYEVFHIDYNFEKWPALRAQYGPRIHLEIESEIARFILESREPGLAVSKIIRQHKLLPLHRALPLWRRRNPRATALFVKP